MGNTGQNQEVEPREKVTSTDLVYRCICEFRETGRVASRQTIRDATNLPLTVVDDRVKYLKAIGKIRLAGGNVAGIYEPTEDQDEDRPISITIMANGRVKYEIGDTVVEMSRREASKSGTGFAGFTLLFRGS